MFVALRHVSRPRARNYSELQAAFKGPVAERRVAASRWRKAVFKSEYAAQTSVRDLIAQNVNLSLRLMNIGFRSRESIFRALPSNTVQFKLRPCHLPGLLFVPTEIAVATRTATARSAWREI